MGEEMGNEAVLGAAGCWREVRGVVEVGDVRGEEQVAVLDQVLRHNCCWYYHALEKCTLS